MINYNVVVKLRDALSNLYWYKKDLVNVVRTCTSEWVSNERMQTYSKKELAYQVIDRLYNDHKYDEINNLITQVLSTKDFSHFDGIENGDEFKKRAIESVKALEKLIKNK